MEAQVESDFDRFWQAYPKKYAKGIARLQFKVAIKKTSIERMLAALEWQKKTPQWTKANGEFVPKPQNWLHGECWDDEPFFTTERRTDKLSGLREFIDG